MGDCDNKSVCYKGDIVATTGDEQKYRSNGAAKMHSEFHCLSYEGRDIIRLQKIGIVRPKGNVRTLNDDICKLRNQVAKQNVLSSKLLLLCMHLNEKQMKGRAEESL